jgi:hypothetical protein
MRKRGAIWLFLPPAPTWRLTVTLMSGLMGALACRETYIAPVVSTKDRYLVVEAFINNGIDSTLISLTRSFSLDDSSTLRPELNAQVAVEGRDNSSYPIPEIGNGQYGLPGLALNNALQYRLHIKTSAGKEYRSDYVDLKVSPPIDSVNWRSSDSGLQIYVNTHDPQGTTRHYRWEYQQTWQFNSVYFSNYAYTNHQLIPRTFNNFYTCWKSGGSTNILLGSSDKLSQDEIAGFPLVLIPPSSWMISIKYSILVKQYPLTPEGYAFWSDLQKNSEQLGSIFSPEPSQSKGNIHSVTDTSEMVIGYVEGGTLQRQRIYITPDQIPDWLYSSYDGACRLDTIGNDPKDLMNYLGGVEYLPIDLTPFGAVSISSSVCADCRLIGTNIKPSFWP